MKLALCQTCSGTDKAANLDEIERFAERAAAEGADLAVFPEFSMYCQPAMNAEFAAQAEALDGPFATRLGEIASRLGIVLVAGMLERSGAAAPGGAGEAGGAGGAEASGPDPDPRPSNALVAATPDGIAAVYRKAHLYDAFGYRESEFIRPGDLEGPVTLEVGGVRVGLLTCYDLRFPEAARQHADAGVDLLLYPAAWVPGPRKEDHWQTLARARAIENTLYVGALSQAPRSGVGGSLIVDPMGVVLGEIGERPGIALAAIDPERIAQVRAANPSLLNRRFTVAPR
ncbi:MAG: carbon-nitrogen hydrolase family protein [Leucobacter sp.]